MATSVTRFRVCLCACLQVDLWQWARRRVSGLGCTRRARGGAGALLPPKKKHHMRIFVRENECVHAGEGWAEGGKEGRKGVWKGGSEGGRSTVPSWSNIRSNSSFRSRLSVVSFSILTSLGSLTAAASPPPLPSAEQLGEISICFHCLLILNFTLFITCSILARRRRHIRTQRSKSLPVTGVRERTVQGF